MPYRTLHLALLLPGLLLAAGCSDNDGTTSLQTVGRIDVEISVVDTGGNPVPNLDLCLASDHPYLQKTQGADKAVVRTDYSVSQPGLVTITVADIQGRRIRTLVSEWVTAGSDWWKWDGKDNNGVDQNSGRYTITLTLHDENDDLVDSDSVDVLMSLARKNPVGTTNAIGQLSLTDRRLFPHLYNKDPMVAMDENAEAMGMLDLDGTMYFRFYNHDRTLWHEERQPVTGSGKLTFVWDPEGKSKAEVLPPPPPEIRSLPLSEGVQIRAYPNPFN